MGRGYKQIIYENLNEEIKIGMKFFNSNKNDKKYNMWLYVDMKEKLS